MHTVMGGREQDHLCPIWNSLAALVPLQAHLASSSCLLTFKAFRLFTESSLEVYSKTD